MVVEQRHGSTPNVLDSTLAIGHFVVNAIEPLRGTWRWYATTCSKKIGIGRDCASIRICTMDIRMVNTH